jgi:hypothetical protein
MSNLDYENLFIYMSLVFAISIFIVLLLGSVFACGSVQQPRVYEQFLDYPTDIKIQVATTFSDYEKKLTDAEEKKKITGIIEKINTNKIGAKDLISLTYELKKISPAGSKDTKDTSKDAKETPVVAKDAKDTTDPTEEIKND